MGLLKVNLMLEKNYSWRGFATYGGNGVLLHSDTIIHDRLACQAPKNIGPSADLGMLWKIFLTNLQHQSGFQTCTKSPPPPPPPQGNNIEMWDCGKQDTQDLWHIFVPSNQKTFLFAENIVEYNQVFP